MSARFGAHRSREGDDLAGADLERQVVDDRASGEGRMVDREVLDFEHK